ncbi:MAG: Holliday junction branch migration protein RuvA [Planctomycetota bacterium]|jgi:Holliday junction DNA helicase RuvA
MIARIEGQLTRLDEDTAHVQVGPITYEIMLPGYCVNALADKVDTEIVLCITQYYEGTPGGGNLIPRMIGFLNSNERDFFSRFVSVKGIGIKKGLKSLSIPIETIAAAIENSDEKTLLTLSGIGKRMAQHIIAELKGKLAPFAAGAEIPTKSKIEFKPFQLEALEILVAWGEKRNESMELIELAVSRHPDIVSAEQLVPIVYRLKQGIEV